MVTLLVAGDGVEERARCSRRKAVWPVVISGEMGEIVYAGVGHTHHEEGKP